VVTNSMAKLKIHGESPVGDGLLKALAMARTERSRNPGSRSLVVLLSDCCPEPLTRRFEDIFDEPAYKEAVRAAQLYRRGRTNLLVINPVATAMRGATGEYLSPGVKLSEKIARGAGGRLMKIEHRSETSRISSREIAACLDGIEQAFQGGRASAGGTRYVPGQQAGAI
jgi:Mg-chelatase subunit ChlD